MNIQFKMAARSEEAGRTHHEDNFQVIKNLSTDSLGFKENEVVELSEKGALLVVCDGMGGMNAGECASATAVDTIKEWFSSEKLTGSVISSQEAIIKHINDAIVSADSRIKEEGKKDKNKEGMGTTIVMAWLTGNHVYVAWCGDSRAYRFNPSDGFEQLSHDHSYVQELVDERKLTRELAFDHPNSNIVTRSLGDPRKRAKPDIKCFPVRNQDIFLLCSDGLSGVLRDREMAAIIEQNTNNMGKCKDTLWNESEKAGWDDNVTLVLCQIVACDNQAAPKIETTPDAKGKPGGEKTKSIVRYLVLWIALFLFGAALGYYGYKWYDNRNKACKTIDELKEQIEDLGKKQQIMDRSNKKIEILDGLNRELNELSSLLNKSLKSDSCDSDLIKRYNVLETQIDSIFDLWKRIIKEEINSLLLETQSGKDSIFLETISNEIDDVHKKDPTIQVQLFNLLNGNRKEPDGFNDSDLKHGSATRIVEGEDQTKDSQQQKNPNEGFQQGEDRHEELQPEDNQYEDIQQGESQEHTD